MNDVVYIGNTTYVNVGFEVKYGRSDERVLLDDYGSKCRKKFMYIPNQLHTSTELPIIQEQVGSVGRAIIGYIIKNLHYNDLNISLDRNVLAKALDYHPNNISKGLTKLTKVGLITPIYKCVKDVIVDTNLYAINFNHIYKGNYEDLERKISIYERNKDDMSPRELITYFENNPNLTIISENNENN